MSEKKIYFINIIVFFILAVISIFLLTQVTQVWTENFQATIIEDWFTAFFVPMVVLGALLHYVITPLKWDDWKDILPKLGVVILLTGYIEFFFTPTLLVFVALGYTIPGLIKQ